jgi:FixJ family two-component response regulator
MRTVVTKSKRAGGIANPSRAPLVAIVDDDQSVRVALERLLNSVGFRAKVLASAEDLISSDYLGQTKCLILDVHMPGRSGLEHQARLVLLTLTPPHDRKH